MIDSVPVARQYSARSVDRLLAAIAIVLSVCSLNVSFGQERSSRDVQLAKDLAFRYVDAQSRRENEIGDSTDKPISFDVIRSILSPGEVYVEFLGVEVPDDVKNTTSRAWKAFEKNWPAVKDAVEKADEGSDAAYELLLKAGITDEELVRLEEFKKYAKLTAIDTGRIQFVELPDDKFQIRDLHNASALDRLIIDLKNDTAIFQSCTLTSDHAIISSADQIASGPYDARSWTKLNETSVSDASDLTRTKLFIGRLTKTDENMICLKTELIVDGISLGGESLVIRFKR